MGLDLRLDMKMSQQLVMTPQLQQAIKLLQLSRTDLIDAIRDELMENPLLEEHSEIQNSEAKVETAKEVERRELKEATADVKVDENTADNQQIDWEAYFENYSSPTPGTGTQRLRDDDMSGMEASTAALLTTRGALAFLRTGRNPAIALIGNINDDGYPGGFDENGKPVDPN